LVSPRIDLACFDKALVSNVRISVTLEPVPGHRLD
jgi:hypothetical protein